MSEVTSSLNQPQNHDAQLAAEEIAEGQVKAPDINVEADYEASKEFSVSEVDKTGEGAQVAEAATAPHHELHAPEEPSHEAKQSGNPEDFKEIAKEVGHAPQGAHNVSNNQVQKAIELGQPGE